MKETVNRAAGNNLCRASEENGARKMERRKWSEGTRGRRRGDRRTKKGMWIGIGIETGVGIMIRVGIEVGLGIVHRTRWVVQGG